jgi:hypothetical protein
MTLSENYHLSLLQNFYLKKNDLDIKLSSQNVDKPKKAITVNRITNEIEYSWNFPDTKRFKFQIPSTIDELTGQDLSKLNNFSFLHSLLYVTDPTYYSGLTEQKREDCIEVIEILRKDFYIKQKISKEASEILKNLENNIYTDLTIQHIISFFNSFHLIILCSDCTQSPKLFVPNQSKKSVKNYNSAPAIIMMYFDHNREIYYPILYKEDCLYVTWRDSEFLPFIKNIFLWGKPTQTKKWAVADLRDWITFFQLPIDPELSKNEILEKMAENMGSN